MRILDVLFLYLILGLGRRILMLNLIFAFSGMGKTNLSKMSSKIIDLETLRYEWIYQSIAKDWEDEKLKGRDDLRVRNPNFPKNYVGYVEQLTETEQNFIFCPTNELVINELINRGHSYVAIYPSYQAFKKYYLKRFESRGNSQSFIQMIEENYKYYIDTIKKGSVINIEVKDDSYLSDYISLLNR